MKREITCFCENSFTVEIPETVDAGETPGIADSILNGTFLTFPCPKCGTVLKPEFPVRFKGINGEEDLLFIPEIERDAYLAGRTDYKADSIVIGFPELQERFKIRKYGLDERTVELIKVHLLEKTPDTANIRIYFGKEEENQLFFYIEGLKENETAVAKIPRTLYDRIRKQVIEKTYDKAFSQMLSPPYISINKIQTERE